MSAQAQRRISKTPGKDQPRILSLGYSVSLLIAREKALNEAGCQVESVTWLEEASELVEAKQHDLLVIGHRVPEEVRNRAASLFRTRNPNGRIVFLYLGSIHNADMADAVISVLNSPADLAIAISHQVQRARGE